MTEKTLEHRVKQHLSDTKRLNNKLHSALKKYPIDDWNIEILEECADRTQLQEREKYFIKQYNTFVDGYNMTNGGDGMDSENASKLKKMWYETENGKIKKQKLSEQFKYNNPGIDWTGKKHNEETKKKISEKNTGRKMTEEQRKKRSEIVKNQWKTGVFDKRPPQSKESIEKRSRSMMGHKGSEKQKQKVKEMFQKTYEVLFPDGHVEQITNLSEFSKRHKLDQGNLHKTLTFTNRKHKGYKVLRLFQD